MKIQHMRLREPVCLVFDKIVYCREVRECLHAEFAVEAATEGGEDLVFFLGSVPDYIIISIAPCFVERGGGKDRSIDAYPRL
jgi:hypothetical protein